MAFDAEAAALMAFDAEAAADLWVLPGLILDDRYAGVIGSRNEMIEGLERSYPMYRKLGLASVGFEVRDRQQLTDAIDMVRIHWLFYDADGRQLTDSTDHYILRRAEEGLRACVCVQVDDAAKLLALAAEHGIDLPR
jgi:hypothetical protein